MHVCIKFLNEYKKQQVIDDEARRKRFMEDTVRKLIRDVKTWWWVMI